MPQIAKQVAKPAASLRSLGDQLSFHGNAYSHMPRVLRQYPKEVVRLLAEVSLGTGALAVLTTDVRYGGSAGP